MADLYHAQIGFPVGVRLPKGIYILQYSQHALQAAQRDRYGNLTVGLPDMIDMSKVEPFEIEVERGSVSKMVFRLPFQNGLDIVMVVRGKRVITVWGNERSDRHETLNSSRYQRA